MTCSDIIQPPVLFWERMSSFYAIETVLVSLLQYNYCTLPDFLIFHVKWLYLSLSFKSTTVEPPISTPVVPITARGTPVSTRVAPVTARAAPVSTPVAPITAQAAPIILGTLKKMTFQLIFLRRLSIMLTILGTPITCDKTRLGIKNVQLLIMGAIKYYIFLASKIEMVYYKHEIALIVRISDWKI
jgi:hypothetical protein